MNRQTNRASSARTAFYHCPDPTCAWTGGEHAGPGLHQHVKKHHSDIFAAWSRNPNRMKEARNPQARAVGRGNRTVGRPRTNQSLTPNNWAESTPEIIEREFQPKTIIQLQREVYDQTLRARDEVRQQIADTRNLERRERELTEQLASIASTLATMGAPVETPPVTSQPFNATVNTSSAEVHAVSEPEFQHA